MSVNPLIQSPTSTQSVNPYSYIMNNPLAGINPTGYAIDIIICGPEGSTCDAPDGPKDSAGQKGGSNNKDNSGPSGGSSRAPAPPNNGSGSVAKMPPNEGGGATIGSLKQNAAKGGDNQKASEFDFSPNGVKWLKHVEKERLKPYNDATGKDIDEYTEGATIGIGHLITSKKEFGKYKNGITGDQSEALLKSDLSKFISTVRTSVTAEVNQEQFNALVILAYNIGESGFKGSSALKMINNSNLKSVNGYRSVEKAWKTWNKETVNGNKKVSQGLINRREHEWKIYSEGKYETW
jgi:GH24 family phage-related lysozyme (muramidase)